MLVRWTDHALEMFLERAMAYGVNYEELEQQIIAQQLRIWLGENKYKAIFRLGKNYFTVIKTESEKKLKVITLWESNEKEVFMWINK